MYRLLTLAFAVLCSGAAAAGDFPSAYVAPGGIYAPSAQVYVDSGSGYREPPYAERSHAYGRPYAYGQPSYGYGTPGPAYRAPASVYGEYGPAHAAQPVYIERAPAYPERYYAPEPYYAQERDYAPRPPLPVPYRTRGARCVVDDGYGRWASCD